MTAGLLTLYAENSGGVRLSEVAERCQSAISVRVLNLLSVDPTAMLHVASSERLTIFLRVSKLPKMDVVDADVGKTGTQAVLGKAWAAADRVQAYIGDGPDIPCEDVLKKALESESFVAYGHHRERCRRGEDSVDGGPKRRGDADDGEQSGLSGPLLFDLGKSDRRNPRGGSDGLPRKALVNAQGA